jgi:hypothetical protein
MEKGGNKNAGFYISKKSRRVFVVDSISGGIEYTLIQDNDRLLRRKYIVQSKSKNTVGEIIYQHILFMPAKLSQLTLYMDGEKKCVIKKDLVQLRGTVNVESADLKIKGELFSQHFELLYKDKCIALFDYDGSEQKIHSVEEYDDLIALFAFAMELAR